MTAPCISTARLRLRPHRMDDLEAFWTFYQSPRAVYMDRPNSRTHLWYGLASEVGSWDLQGQGGWAIETLDGALAGQVAITHPPHFPERELGWLLFEGFEGRGLGYEAASAARNYAFGPLGADTLVSYIHADNARSIALAVRLGATRDDAAERHDAQDLVYRYPAPEALQ
ncbi:GNAT family N-acetyltransferase [Actibacterium sp. D379-3]